MKKLAALFCLTLALLATAVPGVHAHDYSVFVIPPNTPAYSAVWIVNGQQVNTSEYANVTEVDFSDGTVQPLDTSDGSNYTLDFPQNGGSTFVTKWLNGTVVSQWIATDD